ncbi:acyl--CoA ligase [Planomonospora sp. ID67723]|uniref:class I adenylate-forming enzyme family protein n=1 Tax=Planomonospora sp. ID67723 TaxID=2738134 RepID=UPI0018C379EA|nr:AMP-binding protein [Planomonospora sp. ID67723]MBG0828773.1 acyl--CoA ligase [Planomonospora sp. ID67723]
MLRLLAGEAARRFGGRVAVDSGSLALSFAELDRVSDGVAAGLAHRGVRMGDLVALALPDGPEFPICYLAAAKIGAVTAGLRPGPAVPLRRLDPALVVTAPGLLPPLPALDVVTLPLTDRPGKREPYDTGRLAGLHRAERPPPPLPPDPGRPVAVVFTSGTTGTPRGAVFSDRQLEAVRAHGAGLRWGTGDPRLLFRHLGHLTFMTRLPVFLQTGRTAHVLPRWEPAAVLRVLAEHRLGVLQGTPGQLAGLLAHESRAARGRTGLPHLRLVLSSGGPPGAGLVRALRERFGVPVCNRYLCTEAGLGLGTRPEDPPQDAEHTVGRPRGGVSLALRDPAGRSLPPGEVGEVLLRSGAVTSGYYRDAGASARILTRDGFVRTGDMGYLDHVGRLSLVGRVPVDTQSRA